MKTPLLAAVLVAFSLPVAAKSPPKAARECGALPATFEGVGFVDDGDTINVVGMRPGVRLWGLNAAELRDRQRAETVAGMKARALVADLLTEADNKVRCEPIEWDKYCRVVSTCLTGAGVDLTMATLKAGLAYGFYLAKHPQLVETALSYAKAETEARREKRGLWPVWMGEK
ncbi:MAG: thermonuclease family protein [Reyranella sp.]